MASGRASWSALARAEGNAARFGAKAATLARASRELPVVPGWTLDVGIVKDLDHTIALDLAHELIALHPTGRWLLRSSSPLEDTATATSAGLFASVGADAVPEIVATALLRVAESARDPRVRALLAPRSSGALPLAVLAQPHLRFRRWCTVEWRAEHGMIEGWSVSADGSPSWTRTALADLPREWTPLRALAERVRVWDPTDALLLELGEDDQGTAWLLQSRRAPRATPRTRPATAEITPLATAPDLRGLGTDVHAGDAQRTWRWDREHCPTALCPLLAGLFAQFILDHPTYPSRLAQGRWHDELRSDLDLPSASFAQIEHELAQWREHERLVLRPGLERLRAETAARWNGAEATTRWQSFTRDWMRWQAQYYATSSRALRSWAHTTLNEAASRGEPAAGLGPTVASERARRWSVLADDLRRHPQVPIATAQAVQEWVQEHAADPVARALQEELARCHHLCAFAFDGRGTPWEFEPLPFWRAIAHRLRRPSSVAPGVEGDRIDVRARTVRAILAQAEDDDDLLLQAYHQWHRALRRLARAGGVHAPHDPTVLLDLLPMDLLHWARSWDEDLLREGLARGRALAHAWDAWTPPRATGMPDRLKGVPAAPGRAEGGVHRALHLEEIDPDEETIAVVATIGPSDAVHVAGLAALVCEGGDVLGHASILARESGVPCVVGVESARLLLRHAARVLVDGDRGEIVVTSIRG